MMRSRRVTSVSPAPARHEPGNGSTQMMRLMLTLMAILKSARLLAILLLLVPALAACGESQSQPQATAPPPPQVTIAKPVSKMIADQDEYVGRFVAVDAVQVRAPLPRHLAPTPFTY